MVDVAAAPKKRKAAAGKKKKGAVVRGKRKEAIARAWITPNGTGRVSFNRLNINTMSDAILHDVILEPLTFLPADARATFDVSVVVRGGGPSGQAQAARTAIARALVDFVGGDELKAQMMTYDRSLLVEDSRRVEPKKFKGPGARARFTKSYR
jgi:small subunit ribosomal protein S9